jgi:hypothetical protein
MKIYNWFSTMGSRVVLLFKTGPKFITLITIEPDGLRLVKILRADEKFLTEAGSSTKKVWKDIARKPGTTKTAKQALKQLLVQ